MTTNEVPRELSELDRLVFAAKGGDRPAFDELVRRTYVDVYRELRAAGYTAVGEFHYLGFDEALAAVEAADEAGVRIVLLLAAYGRGGLPRFRQESVVEYLRQVDLVLLDIKSWDPQTYRHAVGQDIKPTLQFAERLAALGKPVWVRFVLVPGLTDDPANVEGIARFVAPMRNVEWVEILPFHQMGAFKWQAMGLDYELSDTSSPSPELVDRVIGQFQDAGCRAR